MTSKSVKYIFGLLLILAFSLQITEHFIDSTIEKDNIELSDWDEESQEDTEDIKVVWTPRSNDEKDQKENQEITDLEITYILLFYLKIPSPPPELV